MVKKFGRTKKGVIFTLVVLLISFGVPPLTQLIVSAKGDPPVADPGGPYTGKPGETITFDGSKSYDPDGYIVSYEWDFGDGTTGSGVTTTHSYSKLGTYTVSLTVTDNEGLTDTAYTRAFIKTENQPPVADPDGPYSGYAGTPITFYGWNSYDPDGIIVKWEWDFGDGTTRTGVNWQHTYKKEGVYTVTLTVTDNEGATDTATTTATVKEENKPPVAEAGGPYLGKAGETITFDGSKSYDPDGYIVSYEWDFGDGTKATGSTVEHKYSKSGMYTVTLTVTDDAGAQDTDAAKVILPKSKSVSVKNSTKSKTNHATVIKLFNSIFKSKTPTSHQSQAKHTFNPVKEHKSTESSRHTTSNSKTMLKSNVIQKFVSKAVKPQAYHR